MIELKAKQNGAFKIQNEMYPAGTGVERVVFCPEPDGTVMIFMRDQGRYYKAHYSQYSAGGSAFATLGDLELFINNNFFEAGGGGGGTSDFQPSDIQQASTTAQADGTATLTATNNANKFLMVFRNGLYQQTTEYTVDVGGVHVTGWQSGEILSIVYVN